MNLTVLPCNSVCNNSPVFNLLLNMFSSKWDTQSVGQCRLVALCFVTAAHVALISAPQILRRYACVRVRACVRACRARACAHACFSVRHKGEKKGVVIREPICSYCAERSVAGC